jgi:hypothetical protein
MPTSPLRIETITAKPVRLKDIEVSARSQVVKLRLPIASGGLTWNRPVAVVVRTQKGQDRILPVPNVTRTAVLALVGLCFASMILLRLFRR